MKNVIIATISLNLFGGISCIHEVQAAPIYANILSSAGKIDIKIKNDGDEDLSVINQGSGGTYRLQKNVTTTIKMELGDELYLYVKGKKTRLLLIATESMNGKLQLTSKL